MSKDRRLAVKTQLPEEIWKLIFTFIDGDVDMGFEFVMALVNRHYYLKCLEFSKKVHGVEPKTFLHWGGEIRAVLPDKGYGPVYKRMYTIKIPGLD